MHLYNMFESHCVLAAPHPSDMRSIGRKPRLTSTDHQRKSVNLNHTIVATKLHASRPYLYTPTTIETPCQPSMLHPRTPCPSPSKPHPAPLTFIILEHRLRYNVMFHAITKDLNHHRCRSFACICSVVRYKTTAKSASAVARTVKAKSC